MLTDKWRAVLPFVRSPARYTDGEWNAYLKPFDGASARAVLVYPDVYEAGVCDYGLALLYQILNEHPHYAADRAYLPWPDMQQAMRSRGLVLSGIESGRPLAYFDVVGIALADPLCFTAVPAVLALAGLSPRSSERGAEDPIVLGGGAAAVNPEPVVEFFDAMLLGEGEEAILQVMEVMAQTRGQDRRTKQEALASVDGLYVPTVSQGGTVKYRTVEDLARAPLPYRPPVPFVESLGECASAELSRGCACGWRLCPVRHVWGEARRRPAEAVAESGRKAIRSTGYDQVALFGADGCDGGELEAVVEACVEALRGEAATISLPPLRPPMVAALRPHLEGRALDLDVGPASDRLRAMLQMCPSSGVMQAVEEAAQAGSRNIRLHVTVGLPAERDDDVRFAGTFVNEAARAARSAASGSHRPRVTARFSAFVPRPHTPLQWFGSVEPGLLRHRLAILRETAARRDPRLRLPQPEVVQLSATLARGGRSTARGLAAGCEAGLHPVSAAAEHSAAQWLKVLECSGCDVPAYANRRLELDEDIPWKHLAFASSREDLRALAQGIVQPE